MGAEARCVGHLNQRSSEGKALLETDYLLFRGDFRVKVPFQSISNGTAAAGQLSISFEQGTLRLDLGPAAEKWLRKIQHPPSLMEKLGVKPGNDVSVIGIHDEAFLTALEAVSPGWKKRVRKQADFIFLAVESPGDLPQIAQAEAALVPAGALWAVWPKGQKHITASQVMAAGKAAGLVDTKTASFSQTHTALKWMIPVARRAAAKEP